MLRLRPFVLAGLIVLVTGCTRATFGFRPSLTSQVPDSTVVRFRVQSGEPLVTGRSLDWQTGTLRVVRGSSWVTHDVDQLRCAHRQKVPADTYAYSIGFRVVYSEEGAPVGG